MFLVFYTTCSWETNCYSIKTDTIDTVIWSPALTFCSRFRSDIIFQFFLGKSKIQQICVASQNFEQNNATHLTEKDAAQLQHSRFCVLKNEESDNDWFFVFNLCFGEVNFIQRVVQMIYLFKELSIISRICFFCHRGTYLEFVGSHSWSGNHRSYWLEASLSLRRHLGLDFPHLAFLRPLLTAQSCWSFAFKCTQQNSAFLQTRRNCRWNNSTGVIVVPISNLKLVVNIFRG